MAETDPGAESTVGLHKAENRVQTICLLILTTIAIAMALLWLQSVIVPFVLAAFLSMILTPIVDFQILKLKIPRAGAIIITLLIVFVVIAFLGVIVAASLSEFASRSGEFEAQLSGLFNDERFVRLLASLDIDVTSKIDLRSLIPVGALKRTLTWLAFSVTTVISQSFLVMLFAVFLMVGHDPKVKTHSGAMGQIEAGVRNYVNAKVAVSAITGFLVFLILHLIGVPFAPTFGAFAFLLNFIPNIGSIIATLLPMPIVMLTPGFTPPLIALALILPTIVQLTVANVVEPKIMGKSLDLHPITILIALIFWGIIWGFLGMVLAVPITAVIKIILEAIDFTKPVSEVFAGRFDSFGVEPDSL